jgi:hypothetical protein
MVIGSGRKNLLATLEKKYSLFVQSQITWRGDSTHTWTKGAETRRVFLQRQPVPEALGVIGLLGKQIKQQANDWLFQQLQDQWGSRNIHFNTFRKKYADYKKQCEDKNESPQEFQNWTAHGPRTSREKQWQSMDKCVYEVERVTLDGILFRSEPSQDRKGTKTDNSYIYGQTKVTDRNGQTTTEDCYGRIQKLYLHFMYPPTSPDLENATDKRRIDPYKIQTAPWHVYVKCKWYKSPTEQSYNPINGLLQVQNRSNWDNSCPFISLSNCYAKNLMLWPSLPFDERLYDKKGELLPNTIDNRNRSEELHDVIFHHD